MDKRIPDIIEEAVHKFYELRSKPENGISPVPPVLWFGNLESEKERILVISANPNKPHLPAKGPRIPCYKDWKEGDEIPDVETLEKEFNEYFRIDLRRHPSTNWFGQKDDQKGQGRIEQFINGLGASFYESDYPYQAIHIDLIPFSTEKLFTRIADRLIAENEWLPTWIDKHIREMIEIVGPKLIVVNGASNFYYFNLCVNLGAQPYTCHQIDNQTIWISSSNPPIIATNVNMGSSCRLGWKELTDLGAKVKSIIQE